MIKDHNQWTTTIRDLSLLPDSPIQQRNGKWRMAERLAAWKELGPRLFDDYLDRFQLLTIEVLREKDSQFELDPDRRFASSLYGKGLKHSHELRKGLAETLALLASYPENLTSCSHGKAEHTARSTVQAVLENSDWELWGSLNDVLPLLAEAAPLEFLNAVEEGLTREPCPFDQLFAQESSAFTGRNYMTGLLWAFEGLAWSDEYLTRVVIILGELAARDPGGNWGNRPGNSLWAILLPWFPQTLASIQKRLSAVATLQNEFPEVAWKLLLNLLPQSQQSSSMNHKPTFRRIIPDDWSEGVTNRDYWEQITGYAELALRVARQDRTKLVTLLGHFNNLPPATRQEILSYLESEEMLSLSQEDRLPIWNKLVNLVSRHRKYSDANWAMSQDAVSRIASVAERLEPKSPEYKYRRLFIDRDIDLYQEKGDYAEQSKKLDELRQTAIFEIYSLGGTTAVARFAEAVDSPGRVGFAFGVIAPPEVDTAILPKFLDPQSTPLIQFAANFLMGRFRAKGWQWVDSIDVSQWTTDQIALFLAYLPFVSETWSRAKSLLGPNESAYWAKTNANPYDAKDKLGWAIDRLIENGRVLAAVAALEKQYYSKEPQDSGQIIRALLALLQSPENLRAMDPHAVAQLLVVLQNDPHANADELLKLEWAFLALLDGSFDASPTLLQKTLANDPKFFCEVIRTAFRSDKEDQPVEKLTAAQEGNATNAHRLLREWKIPPGLQEDGTFDGAFLNAWLTDVKVSCAESGHLKIAMQQVGEVLLYVPGDPDGLWLHRSVATILNAKDADDLRLGFEVEIFNSRGGYFVDPEGKPERELANSYRKKADDVEIAGYHRLAITLRAAAASYDREAERNILSARIENNDDS